MLVVIAIVAIPLTLLLPAVASLREKASRLTGADNLRQAFTAVSAYANANDAKLPQHPSVGSHFHSGYFLYALPLPTRDALTFNGTSRHVLYCPSGYLELSDFTFGEGPMAPRYCVSGYAWLWPRPGAEPPPIRPPKSLPTRLNVPNAVDLELAFDIVISANGKFTGNASTPFPPRERE